MEIKLKICNIRSVDTLKKEEESCCGYPQHCMGYVTKPKFAAKYCQTCHTVTLQEKRWVNKTWMLLCKPFWNKKKIFHWSHSE